MVTMPTTSGNLTDLSASDLILNSISVAQRHGDKFCETCKRALYDRTHATYVAQSQEQYKPHPM